MVLIYNDYGWSNRLNSNIRRLLAMVLGLLALFTSGYGFVSLIMVSLLVLSYFYMSTRSRIKMFTISCLSFLFFMFILFERDSWYFFILVWEIIELFYYSLIGVGSLLYAALFFLACSSKWSLLLVFYLCLLYKLKKSSFIHDQVIYAHTSWSSSLPQRITCRVTHRRVDEFHSLPPVVIKKIFYRSSPRRQVWTFRISWHNLGRYYYPQGRTDSDAQLLLGENFVSNFPIFSGRIHRLTAVDVNILNCKWTVIKTCIWRARHLRSSEEWGIRSKINAIGIIDAAVVSGIPVRPLTSIELFLINESYNNSIFHLFNLDNQPSLG